jgi:uncharacterized protein
VEGLKLQEKKFLENLVKKELKGIPLFGLSQINRVKNFVLQISHGKEFDFEIVELAVMLHNIGAKQFLQFNQDLIKTSKNMAKNFLKKLDYKDKRIESVLHCIEEMHLKGHPKTFEAKIIHDAVQLDYIGAIGFTKDSIVFWIQRKSLQEFFEFIKFKSIFLKETFFTEKGRELSIKGIRIYKEFVEDFEKNLIS